MRRLVTTSPQLAVLLAVAGMLRTRLADVRADSERGSVTLEQVVISAGLLAIALAVVAAIVAVVHRYMGQLGA
jgi:hypothetical protein